MLNRLTVSVLLVFILLSNLQAQRKLGEATFRHIETIAADTFEGRLAGSTGGYAAANYITKILADHDVHEAQAPSQLASPGAVCACCPEIHVYRKYGKSWDA